jgi:osmotically inducible lipoprotein OsmB
MMMQALRNGSGLPPRTMLLVALVGLSVAGCESGTGGPGVGTVGGAALGAGAGRAIFGSSTSAMLIGGAVGGMVGNATLDRQAQERQAQQTEASRDRAMQRQLDFERQRALQQADVQRQIEEQRLFDEWRRQQGQG